jgi:hypothetical protein
MDVLTKYGENSPITQREADPVHCCLSGSYLNCPENPMKYDLEMCTNFMADRCARQWDSYCDLYITELDGKSVTGKYSSPWLDRAAESKYCRDDTSNPNSHCITKCELVNPSGNGGAIVCSNEGETIYRDKNQFYNISTNFAENAGLDSTSPLKATKCPKTCDLFSATGFDNTDRIMNECLDRGVCQPILMNLAEKVVQNNIPVTNDRFRDFINRFILTNKATQPSLAASLGGNAPIITTQPNTVAGANVTLPVQAPSGTVGGKEGFQYPPDVVSQHIRQEQPMQQVETNSGFSLGTWVGIIVLLLIIVALIYTFARYGKDEFAKHLNPLTVVAELLK